MTERKTAQQMWRQTTKKPDPSDLHPGMETRVIPCCILKAAEGLGGSAFWRDVGCRTEAYRSVWFIDR
jgi:hypothetical protein